MRRKETPRRYTALLILCVALLSSTSHGASTPSEDAPQLASQGKFAEAVKKFEEAIRSDSKNASLFLGLGLAQQSLRKYPEAIQALEKAAKLAPNSADAFYSLGLLYEAAATDPSLLGEPKSDANQKRFWQMARQNWEQVVRSSKDIKRVATAKEHLNRISEALQ